MAGYGYDWFYRGFRGPPPNKIRFVLQNEYLAFYNLPYSEEDLYEG